MNFDAGIRFIVFLIIFGVTNYLMMLRRYEKDVKKKKYLVGDSLSIADISIAAQLSLIKFPKSAGPILSGEGCQEYINNPYLENLFMWRNNLEEYLFSANSQ